MYLNNSIQTTSTYGSSDDQKEIIDFERQRLETKRRELVEKCKHIRSIFESSQFKFHPHEEAVADNNNDNDSSSYLEMNGANNKNRQIIKNLNVTSDDGESKNGKEFLIAQ